MIADAESFEGKYEILAKIREGGMGAVYKVRHRLLDEVRVIKVIRPQLSTSPEMGERFLREARLAIRVRHPNIAQLHDFSIDADGTAYIVMELIDGLTLADVLARMAPLPLGLALEIARGTLGAIGYLHRRSMVHRDISPDNVMLGRDEEGAPRVTLLDLGIAKSLVGSSALTSAGAFLGKPRYASPEHFGAEGLEAVGPYSDLYSFGVVLYELLTGVCPIQGRDTSSWIAGHLFRPPVDFAESDARGRVPLEVRSVLLKALAKAPADRFASADEMARALEPVRARCPVEPGALERALGAAPPDGGPAEPPPPGTTQDAFDRRFAPVATPSPRPEDRAATLVLRMREDPEPPPRREPAAPPPARRQPYLIPALVALGLLVSASAIWWMVRAPAPEPTTTSAGSPTRPPPLPQGLPKSSSPPAKAAPVAQAPTEPPVVAPPELPPPERPRPSVAERSPRTTEPRVVPAPRPKAPAQPPVEAETPTPAPDTAPEPRKPETAAPSSAATPDHPAELVGAPVPTYPEIARGTGLRAQIFVKVYVDEKGKVTNARVEKAYAQRGTDGKDPTREQALAFREAALAAARRAAYRPALQNGQPTGMWKQIVFDFRE